MMTDGYFHYVTNANSNKSTLMYDCGDEMDI